MTRRAPFVLMILGPLSGMATSLIAHEWLAALWAAVAAGNGGIAYLWWRDGRGWERISRRAYDVLRSYER